MSSLQEQLTVMKAIQTISLDRYSKILALSKADNRYVFVALKEHPYIEEPYRAESYAIGYLHEGSIEVRTGLLQKIVHAPAIITMGPSVIRSFRKSSDSIRMDILFFKEEFLLENQTNVFMLMKYAFFEKSEMNVLHLDMQQQRRVSSIYKLIEETATDQHVHESSIVRSFIYILLHEIDAMHQAQQTNVASASSETSNPLFARFRQLLTKEYLRQRSVGYYADQLNVTPKYLSEVIKKHTGRTAGDWIDEAVTLEAKVLLQNTSLTVAQVSDILNFSDQSVFGKFFKANTGLTPLDYRKKIA
jgi:AraC family transcriptional activator of pobA